MPAWELLLCLPLFTIITVIITISIMDNLRQNRYSRQRDMILHILQNTHIHPAAEWVYKKAQREIPRISLGTVYRNLRLLNAQGLIRELHIGDSHTRYDIHIKDHQHFVCVQCHRIRDLEAALDWNRDKLIERKYSCRVLSHRIDFFGLCHHCLKASRPLRSNSAIDVNGKKKRSNEP